MNLYLPILFVYANICLLHKETVESERRACHAEKFNNPEQNKEINSQRYVTPYALQIDLSYL